MSELRSAIGEDLAEIGTMRITEQIDALRTLSAEPVQYLAVPRFIASLVMTPVLTFITDVVGVLVPETDLRVFTDPYFAATYHGVVAAFAAAPGVGFQRAALVVVVQDGQRDADRFVQWPAGRGDHQAVHLIAARPADLAHVIVHAQVQQRDFGRLGIITVQLQMDVGQPGRGAAPHGAGQMGAELGQALHPLGGQRPQRGQFGRLGVGAEESQVFPHLVLQLVVAGQRRASGQAEHAQRALLGWPVLQAFLDDQTGRGGGDFGGGVHQR